MPKEPDATADFISELTRAANETDHLTKLQRARLLQRAAVTLHRHYHHTINYSGTPAQPMAGTRGIQLARNASSDRYVF